MGLVDWLKMKKFQDFEYSSKQFFLLSKYNCNLCLPFCPTYIGYKSTPFNKCYGIEMNCYWEQLGKLRNTLKVHSEFNEIMVRTYCEQ